MAKKNPIVQGVVDVEGGPISKTNRFFLALRSYGHCDDKGRTIMGIECSSKKVPAPPDRPLELMAAVLDDLLPVMGYSSNEAAAKDLKAFKEFVSNITLD